MSKALQPDLEMARRFLKVLAGDDEVTFQTFDDHEPKDPKLARVLHGTLDQHAKELIRLNNAGAGIHVMVNKGDLKGRKTENVTGVRAVFIDLDGASVEPVRNAPIRPNIVVQSSPGRYHCYWRVLDCSLEEFEPIQKALAEKFGGDTSVCDLPRVLRLPGFYHRKAEPVMTVMEPE